MYNYIEPTFGIDEFRKPNVLKGWEAMVQTLLIILFGKPGFYPSIPDLGMDIHQYRYMDFDELNTEMIKTELLYQYPLLEDGSVDVRKAIRNDNPVLLFVINVTNETKQSKVLVGVELGENELIYHYDLKDAIEV